MSALSLEFRPVRRAMRLTTAGSLDWLGFVDNLVRGTGTDAFIMNQASRAFCFRFGDILADLCTG